MVHEENTKINMKLEKGLALKIYSTIQKQKVLSERPKLEEIDEALEKIEIKIWYDDTNAFFIFNIFSSNICSK